MPEGTRTNEKGRISYRPYTRRDLDEIPQIRHLGTDWLAEIHGEKVFVLKLIQARDPEWVGRPFFAKFDARATWLDDLVPAFGEPEFFWERGMEEFQRRGEPLWSRKWTDPVDHGALAVGD